MSLVSFQVDERGVARLALNRPDVRNAFNAELIEQITSTIENLPANVRVLVLSGEGKVFSAGADLDWMRSMAAYSLEENAADSSRLSRMFEALDNCRAATIARVHGAAIAGATGLVACSDVAIASAETVFAFTEVRIGLVPAVISPYLMRRTGYSFLRSAFLTAERFDASRAMSVGLVHQVVDASELDEAVEKTVTDLLAAGPEALREARTLVNAVWGRAPADVADLTIRTIAKRRLSPEGQEGVSAFLEKRDPRWRI
ncbi:MAG TPA: enoyl-CoA hydratase-related protein [Actinomycetota bacterium]|nr:enoyl-CoA hydratase-related protein [Actinomycetota bacterium]